MTPGLAALGLAALATVVALVTLVLLHRKAEQHRAALRDVRRDRALLRSALVERGVAERAAQLPSPPAASTPASVKSPPPATVKLRPPAAPLAPSGDDETAPPTTPSQSARRPVPFDDQVHRALARLGGRVQVPRALEERFLARLRALRADLDFSEREGLSDAQIGIMIRARHEAEADAREAREARATVVARDPDATLPSAGGETP